MCYNIHFCTLKPKPKNKKQTQAPCDSCGETRNKQDYWQCHMKKCDYDLCMDCFNKRIIRCPFQHELKYDPSAYDCLLCDTLDYPCYVCTGGKCSKFKICFKCCNDRKRIMDYKGHPMVQSMRRLQNEVVCDICLKHKPSVVSCEPCNKDVCKECAKTDDFVQFQHPK